ncbi:MAG: hypothetical protein EOO81_02895 [Oxalobacteraceae bacterium]|nr:MAG: hypothetical protein EOO81_02895 [Oxalobacteraceae bacterium]
MADPIIAPPTPPAPLPVNAKAVLGLVKHVQASGEPGADDMASKMLDQYNRAVKGTPAQQADVLSRLQGVANDYNYGVDLRQQLRMPAPKAKASATPTIDDIGSMIRAGVNTAERIATDETFSDGLKNAAGEILLGFGKGVKDFFTPDDQDVSQVGLLKGIYNTLPDIAAGSARLPQMATAVQNELTGVPILGALANPLGSVVDSVMGKDTYTDSVGKPVEKAATWLGDMAGKALEHVKFNMKGQDAPLYTTFGRGNAFRAASAINDLRIAGRVDEAVQLTAAVNKAKTLQAGAMAALAMTEPTYQEALRVTNDPHASALFTSIVAPVVGALEIAIGPERTMLGIGRPRSVISGAAAEEIMQPLMLAVREGRATEAMFHQAAQTAAQRFLSGAGKAVVAGVKDGGWEGVGEFTQEGYQVGIEQLFNTQLSPNQQFDSSGRSISTRLIGGGLLGMVMGNGMASIGSANASLWKAEVHKPIAFRVLQEAYQTGGNTGLTEQSAALIESFNSVDDMIMPPEEKNELVSRINTMAQMVKSSGVVGTRLAGANAFHLYDINHELLPQSQDAITELTDLQNALSDQAGPSYPNEAGQYVPIDPVMASQKLVEIEKSLAYEQRRKTYLDSVAETLNRTGVVPESYRNGGLDIIGQYAAGDTVTWSDQFSDPIGKVTDVSGDGQTLTVEHVDESADDGSMTTSQVSALKVKPTTAAAQAATPMADTHGITPHAPGATYAAGSFLLHRSDPSNPLRVTAATTDSAGITTYDVRDADGVTQQIVDEPGDDGVSPIVGTYNPVAASQAAIEQSRRADQDKLVKKIKDPLLARSILSMTAAELTAYAPPTPEAKKLVDFRTKLFEDQAQSANPTAPAVAQTAEQKAAAKQAELAAKRAEKAGSPGDLFTDYELDLMENGQLSDAQIDMMVNALLSGVEPTGRTAEFLDSMNPEQAARYAAREEAILTGAIASITDEQTPDTPPADNNDAGGTSTVPPVADQGAQAPGSGAAQQSAPDPAPAGGSPESPAGSMAPGLAESGSQNGAADSAKQPNTKANTKKTWQNAGRHSPKKTLTRIWRLKGQPRPFLALVRSKRRIATTRPITNWTKVLRPVLIRVLPIRRGRSLAVGNVLTEPLPRCLAMAM